MASPDYLGRRGTPDEPSDLGQHDCLFYPRTGEAAAWSFEPREGASARLSVALHGPLSANNSEMLREAALAGLGVALLPDFSASAALAQGTLAEVLPDWRPVGAFGDGIWAVRPHSAQVPRSVQALVSWLREALH